MTFINYWHEFIVPSENFQIEDLWQLIIVILLLAISSKIFKTHVNQNLIRPNNPILWLKRNRSFLVFWLLITTVSSVCFFLEIDVVIFRFFTLLGGLWIIIGLITSFIRVLFWARSVAVVLYFSTGVLSICPIDESIQILRDFNFTIANNTISAWSILSGIFAFVFTFWLVLALAGIVEAQIQRIPRLSPSLKVLTSKVIHILFILIATTVAMSSVGIDLSALTVLSGAIGLGVGFGMQKVVSNFISGILLLMDNSIKPGDVIEINGTYGWINNLRARYVSIITRDGTEHLIPNEDLITQGVTNWTFSNSLVRMKVPVGVAYGSDPHQCIQLVIDAAKSVERVLHDPSPICLLMGFGDSSVDLELRFWISDPTNGLSNVKSQILLNIWDTFKAHNIEIPFPQRDLHIRSSAIQTSPIQPSEKTQSESVLRDKDSS